MKSGIPLPPSAHRRAVRSDSPPQPAGDEVLSTSEATFPPRHPGQRNTIEETTHHADIGLFVEPLEPSNVPPLFRADRTLRLGSAQTRSYSTTTGLRVWRASLVVVMVPELMGLFRVPRSCPKQESCYAYQSAALACRLNRCRHGNGSEREEMSRAMKERDRADVGGETGSVVGAWRAVSYGP